MISAVSVKDRLKNLAKEDGRTMQDELVTYGLEQAIYQSFSGEVVYPTLEEKV